MRHGFIKVAAATPDIRVADVFLQCDVVFDTKAINHPDKTIRGETRDYFVKMTEYAAACGAGKRSRLSALMVLIACTG